MGAAVNTREHGAALIVVLGLVAIIAGWAAAAAYEDMLSLRRAEHAQQAMQAEMACISALRLAVLMLQEDAKNSQRDDLEEAWATPTPPLPLNDGLVMGEIVDGNRFLNFNDLVDDQGIEDRYAYAAFERLFLSLDIDPSILSDLVDWMDSDSVARQGGTETISTNADHAIKNAHLDRWDELRMIPGFTDPVLRTLAPYATVTPKPAGERTPVNINTADRLVLRALLPSMSDADADSVLASRPYDERGALQGMAWSTDIGFAQLTTNSDRFFVRTQAMFGPIDRREEYLVSRQGGNVQLLWREWKIWQP